MSGWREREREGDGCRDGGRERGAVVGWEGEIGGWKEGERKGGIIWH